MSVSVLSGSPAKSGPLDFGTKNNFPSFFLSVKRVWHIHIKNEWNIFQFLIFCFATSRNWILAELRLPTVIRRVKFANFAKRSTSRKVQLTKSRFHSKVNCLEVIPTHFTLIIPFQNCFKNCSISGIPVPYPALSWNIKCGVNTFQLGK